MSRKRWTAKAAESPELNKFREKRKWQIALRRYVFQESPSPAYAPYFGLDVKNLRKWLELQFSPGIRWNNFGEAWQLDHLVPVTYFDFGNEEELNLCWNFINLRVEPLENTKNRGNRLDLLLAKSYFQALHKASGHPSCRKMLDKIAQIETSEVLNTDNQEAFVLQNRSYLSQIENYTIFEFELLNSGKSPEEVKKESEILKKWEN